jgi:uncharacterized membrane protein
MGFVNWLHLFATVIWIGGITTNFLVLLPSMGKVLDPPNMGKLMGAIMKRFRVLIYISIGVLIITGIFMNIFNKNYQGFMRFGNTWTVLTLIKHILTIFFIILAIYIFECLFPKLSRLTKKGPSPDLSKFQKLQLNLLITSFILGIIILFLTGIITAISSSF